jgi:protein AroM
MADMERRGVDIIVLFCTGAFPPVASKVPVLYPSAIVGAVVSVILSSRKGSGVRLCIVAPAREQFSMLAQKWDGTGATLLFESLSPYTSGDSDILACADRVARLQCDMIVLDCIGYTEKIRSVFASVARAPVILPRSLLARVAAELLE